MKIFTLGMNNALGFQHVEPGTYNYFANSFCSLGFMTVGMNSCGGCRKNAKLERIISLGPGSEIMQAIPSGGVLFFPPCNSTAGENRQSTWEMGPGGIEPTTCSPSQMLQGGPCQLDYIGLLQDFPLS
jgi:hypothetical protein